MPDEMPETDPSLDAVHEHEQEEVSRTVTSSTGVQCSEETLAKMLQANASELLRENAIHLGAYYELQNAARVAVSARDQQIARLTQELQEARVASAEANKTPKSRD